MANKITSISPQTNHPDRYSVFINDKFAFGISAFDLLTLSLKEGNVLSDAEYKDILNSLDESKCQDYANGLISAKMYTEKKLRQKLKDRNFSDDTINIVVLRLKEYGYIDDVVYAEMFVNEVKQKYGTYKIRQKLFERGVPIEVIEEALTELDNLDTAVSHLKTKLRCKPVQSEDVPKLLRFLAQKGFSYDDAKQALSKYMEDINTLYDE